MKQALAWEDADVPLAECAELDAHLRGVDAESMSVVFATYYLENPSSAFGHTMLFLGSGARRSAVLGDYSVSFEANTSGLSPWSYIPRGLTGGLVARYRLAPMHERIRKYVIEEQRDLVRFPLRVSQKEIDRLVLHLWELKDITFEYGVFRDNCAQKILSLVHAVAPHYGVLPHNTLAALPFEVSRHLADRIGLAGEPTRRPSLSTQFSRLVAGFSAEEKRDLELMLSTRVIPDDASPMAQMAALMWSEVETPDRAFRREAEKFEHRDLVWWRELWTSQVAAVEDAGRGGIERVGAEPVRYLLRAHGPSRFTARGGFRRGVGISTNIGARWLLHSALDPAAGYPPGSSVEVGRLELGVQAGVGFVFEEATILRVEKLAPKSAFESPLAWKVDIGARRLPLGDETPLHLGLEIAVGGGASRSRGPYTALVYGMGGLRPGVSFAGGRGGAFRPLGVLSSGFLLSVPADLRARVSGEYTFFLGMEGAFGYAAALRKGLDPAWDLEVAISKSPERSIVSIGLVYFAGRQVGS